MTLSSNPSYQALASTAAAALGNPTQSIVKAILAQWQCELGNVGYPPTRNNPGNVAKGWADGVGIPYTVQMPNPQPGNPIVTFATPSDGARAYAGGIRTFARYAPARLAVARGDGRAFLIALTGAGYGTSAVCALRVYGGVGSVSTTPAPDAPPSSGAGTVVSIVNATLASTCSQVTILSPANPFETEAIPIPKANIGDPCVRCPSGWRFAIVDPGPVRSFTPLGAQWVPLRDLQPGQANACVAPGVKEGDRTDLGQAGDAAGNAVAAAINGLGGVLAPILVNGALVVGIGALAYSGIRDLLSGGEG